mgnify:CR=1 FL=1
MPRPYQETGIGIGWGAWPGGACAHLHLYASTHLRIYGPAGGRGLVGEVEAGEGAEEFAGLSVVGFGGFDFVCGRHTAFRLGRSLGCRETSLGPCCFWAS